MRGDLTLDYLSETCSKIEVRYFLETREAVGVRGRLQHRPWLQEGDLFGGIPAVPAGELMVRRRVPALLIRKMQMLVYFGPVTCYKAQ